MRVLGKSWPLLDQLLVGLHRFWGLIACLFPIWYSLDHAGRIAPSSLKHPILLIMVALLIVLSEILTRDLRGKGKTFNMHRLKLTYIVFAFSTFVLIIYNIMTRDIQLHDGLVDTRLLFSAMFVIGLLVPMTNSQLKVTSST